MLETHELFGKWMRCQNLSKNWRASRHKCVLALSPQRRTVWTGERNDVTRACLCLEDFHWLFIYRVSERWSATNSPLQKLFISLMLFCCLGFNGSLCPTHTHTKVMYKYMTYLTIQTFLQTLKKMQNCQKNRSKYTIFKNVKSLICTFLL